MNDVIDLPTSFIESNGYVMVFTPVLDLAAQGRTRQEAIQMFDSAVKNFFKELIEKNTTDKTLASLGWSKDTGTGKWIAPKVSLESISVQISLPT